MFSTAKFHFSAVYLNKLYVKKYNYLFLFYGKRRALNYFLVIFFLYMFFICTRTMIKDDSGMTLPIQTNCFDVAKCIHQVKMRPIEQRYRNSEVGCFLERVLKTTHK